MPNTSITREYFFNINNTKFNTKIWTITRTYYFFKMVSFYKKKPMPPIKFYILNLIDSILTIPNFLLFLFNNQSNLVSTNNLENFYLNDDIINKSLYKKLNKNNFIIERVISNSKPKASYSNRFNPFVIQILAKLFSKFIKLNTLEVKDIDYISTELKGSNIEKPINSKYKEYLLYQKVWELLFKFKTIDTLHITDFHNTFSYSLIKTLKSKSCYITEYQHGVIVNLHPAYFSKIKLDEELLPNRLKYYLIPENREDFIYQNTIKSTNYFLKDSVKKNTKKNSVLITATDEDVDYLYEQVSILAKNNKEYTFNFLPRNISPQSILEIKNLNIIKDKNFYECLSETDIHITQISTCALEAYSWKIPNFIISQCDLPIKYFSQFINEGNNFYYLKNNDINTEFKNFLKHKNNKFEDLMI